MKKTKRRPNWGRQWGRQQGYTMVNLAVDTWFSATPERSRFALEREDLAIVYDRRDANRMYKWMARRTSMVEVVRAQLAREAASA